MSQDIGMQDGLPRRFLAWMNERFPLANGLLFFSLYVAAVLLGSFAATGGAVEVGLREVLGFLPVWSFFFLLRVYDEHKDYEQDCQNYPDRILQRGLITLTHLKIAGGLAILVQWVGSLWLDGWELGPITVWWLIVYIYSLLMAKEFFIGEWLEERLTLYAASHMAIMVLALMWMVQIGAAGEAVPWQVGWLAAMAFFSGASFEVTRKLRAPEEERDEVDSYTKVFGVKGAPLVVGGLLGAAVVMLGALSSWVLGGLSTGWLVVLVALWGVPLIFLLKFRGEPASKTRKTAEGVVGLSMIGSYVFLSVVVIVTGGVEWVGWNL